VDFFCVIGVQIKRICTDLPTRSRLVNEGDFVWIRGKRRSFSLRYKKEEEANAPI
jgi:hypothetical protein